MQQETGKTVKKSAPPAVKKPNEVALAEEFSAFEGEVVDTKDLILPKALLMHPTSDLVKKGVRNIGEIIKSNTEEVIAKRGETFEVIVFEKWKEWRIMKKNPQTGRFEFVRLENWTPENDNLPWEFKEGQDEFRRDKTMNFYGVLAGEAEAGTAFPIKLSFVRTAFRAGHKLADAYARALMNKQPPTGQIFKIGAELKEGKGESFFVFTVSPGNPSTEKQRQAAGNWKKIVRQGKDANTIKDHEVDDGSETVNTTSTEEF